MLELHCIAFSEVFSLSGVSFCSLMVVSHWQYPSNVSLVSTAIQWALTKQLCVGGQYSLEVQVKQTWGEDYALKQNCQLQPICRNTQEPRI